MVTQGAVARNARRTTESIILERKGGDRRERVEVLDTDVVYPHPAEITLVEI